MTAGLGFGVSGALGTRLIPDSKVDALLQTACQGGIRVFDTAASYGNGLAETRLGRALSGMSRSDLVISTKAGIVSTGVANRIRRFAPDDIEASVRASLDRLGVEGVDVLFLQGPASGEMGPELFTRLSALKNAGAFVRLGISGRGDELDHGLETGQFEKVMMPIHPFMSAAETNRFDKITASGLPVWAIETSGPGPSKVSLPAQLSDFYALAKALKGMMTQQEGGKVPVADGLRQALTRPVETVMMSTTRLAHLHENLRLMN